jgi:Flp pilus assembly protein TadG
LAQHTATSQFRQKQDQGYVVLATAFAIFALMGMLGLAIDLGRLFIVKSEVQAFADIEAITAAIYLDGTSDGLTAARNSVASSPNRIHFHTQSIPAAVTTVEFAKAKTGPWEAAPADGAGYGFLRLTVRPQVNLMLISAVHKATSAQVTGQAIAAQVPQTFPNGGYIPFTPYALSSIDPTGNFGMQIGQEYAFLWPGNAKKQDVCAGNQVNWPAYDFSDNSKAKGSERGYFEFNSASDIDEAIMGLKQTSPLAIGDIVPMSNGRKQSVNKILEDRAALDTDLTNYSPNNSAIKPSYHGNGMRLVILPINSGAAGSPANQVLGFGAFLLPITYPNVGNQTWCAIYMGLKRHGRNYFCLLRIWRLPRELSSVNN